MEKIVPFNNFTNEESEKWWNDTLRSNDDSLGIDYDFNVTSNNTSSGSANDGDVGDAYDDSVAQKILDFLNLYYLGVIICIGLLGNGRNIVLFILNPGRNERKSPSYYLTALAVADSVFIVTILVLWLSQFGFHLFTLPGFYQTFFYTSSTSSCISGTSAPSFTSSSSSSSSSLSISISINQFCNESQLGLSPPSLSNVSSSFVIPSNGHKSAQLKGQN